MSQRETGRQRVAPPEIDCSTPVKLADRPGLPEQYHQFEPESCAGDPRGAGGLPAPAGAGGTGRGQDPARGGGGQGARAAAGPEGGRVAHGIARAALGVRRGPAAGGGPDRRGGGIADPGPGSGRSGRRPGRRPARRRSPTCCGPGWSLASSFDPAPSGGASTGKTPSARPGGAVRPSRRSTARPTRGTAGWS